MYASVVYFMYARRKYCTKIYNIYTMNQNNNNSVTEGMRGIKRFLLMIVPIISRLTVELLKIQDTGVN